jgi:hypothetical protein
VETAQVSVGYKWDGDCGNKWILLVENGRPVTVWTLDPAQSLTNCFDIVKDLFVLLKIIDFNFLHITFSAATILIIYWFCRSVCT